MSSHLYGRESVMMIMLWVALGWIPIALPIALLIGKSAALANRTPRTVQTPSVPPIVKKSTYRLVGLEELDAKAYLEGINRFQATTPEEAPKLPHAYASANAHLD